MDLFHDPACWNPGNTYSCPILPFSQRLTLMPIRYALLLVVAALLGLAPAIQAQTTLTAGDLVIVLVNADGDDSFAFTPLIPLEAGTEIRFTDNGVSDASGTFVLNEGIVG